MMHVCFETVTHNIDRGHTECLLPAIRNMEDGVLLVFKHAVFNSLNKNSVFAYHLKLLGPIHKLRSGNVYFVFIHLSAFNSSKYRTHFIIVNKFQPID